MPSAIPSWWQWPSVYIHPKGGRMSLRAISAELAAQGFLNENGRPFASRCDEARLVETRTQHDVA
jgi:hypothetical protein